MNHLIIFGGALLTVVVELGFFLLFGFRTKKFIIGCIFINLATNLTLNYTLLGLGNVIGSSYNLVFLLGEALVIIIESGFYLLLEGKKWELIPLTLSANCISILVGFGYYAILALL